MQFYSPLRYPGGKSKLAKFVALVCKKNNVNGHYVEPYAGGASVALHLLINSYVKEVTINDQDRSIYAFWYSILNYTEKFCNRVQKIDINVETWKKFKKIQKNKKKASLFELGYSTFFLNRTNRSGIIDGGVIGGFEQKGKYKIDCRFNREELIKRVKLIAKFKNRIHLDNLDALELIKEIRKRSKNNNVIFYFDPPYYLKGASLYMNHYRPRDHKKVSEKIRKIKHARWIVSYDDVPEIRDLYKGTQKRNYSFLHTAHSPRKGHEILFFSQNLTVPNVSNPVGI